MGSINFSALINQFLDGIPESSGRVKSRNLSRPRVQSVEREYNSGSIPAEKLGERIFDALQRDQILSGSGSGELSRLNDLVRKMNR